MNQPKPLPKKIFAARDNQIQELDDDEVDVELVTPSNLFSTHINLIPMQSAVQGPRLFYGARFYNQALPLVHPEAPLVQNIDDSDPSGASFDEKLGRSVGSVFADEDGEIVDLTPDNISIKLADGTVKSKDLYNNLIFNRKTSISNKPVIKKGDIVKKGQLLAHSNYSDSNGTLALGANARVGLVPYKGFSMDDAIVISDSFAKRLTSDHAYTHEQDFDRDTKGGLNHYVSLFPTAFTKAQIKKMDSTGVIKPGSVVNEGDPLILATRPRAFSSTTSQLGKLSKSMRQSRHDSSQKWDSPFPGTVTDVAKTKTGYKVIVKSEAPAQSGDKIVFRTGQKGIISKILPDEHMPRTKDGKPLEVLLNQLGMPSRVNSSLLYELLLGKAAAARGEPIKVPGFNKKGEKWYDFVSQALKDNNLSETEEVFDPMSNRLLENPITVGVGHVLKLHHMASSKVSSRGQGSYDCYDEETEVLTGRGWIKWPNVLDSDEFYTVIDGQAVYKKASKIVSYDFEGELYGYESKYLNWLTTSNHEHLVRLKKKWKKISAYELYGKTKFSVKQFGFGALPGKSPEKIDIPPPVFTLTKRRQKEWKGCSINIDDYAAFIGWWIAEGSVVFNEKNNRYRVYIWQQDIPNPEKSLEIRNLLSRLPFEWCRHFDANKNLVGYWISDASLAQHLICNYGQYCGSKRLWREIFKLDPKHREVILKNAMLGDGTGCRHKNSNTRIKENYIESYATTSAALADDMQELSIGLGFGALIGKYEKFINSKGYMCKPHFRVGLHRTRNVATACTHARYKGRHVKVPYKGKVYCATIPESGLLYIRRDKKPVLSGNSNQQPLKGGSESAQSKRLSGLEIGSLLSSGAYKTIKEGATLRGQQCFDSMTEVLTRRGWVPWPEVSQSDEFFTQDGNNNAFYEKPVKLHAYKYDGDLYAFEGRYLDWRVTPDHRLWIQHIKSKSKCFKTAEELHGRTFYVPQFGAVYKGSLSEEAVVNIDSKAEWRSPSFTIPISLYCELLGWWLSEGSAYIESGPGKRGVVVISQSGSANPHKLSKIEYLFKKIGLHAGHIRDKEGISRGIRLRNKPLAVHLSQFGSNCTNKHIPDIVFEAPVESRFKLIDAYIAGDGHIANYTSSCSKRASTASFRLADDMQRLAVISGYGAILSDIDRSNVDVLKYGFFKGINPKFSPLKYIGFAQNRRNATVDGWHSSVKFRHSFKERYSGMVYCATLSTGLLYVRRNGKPMWSGNCDDYWRALRQGYKPQAPGAPFVWEKFKALLTGAGLQARKLPKGELRLGPFTDDDLDKQDALEVKSGDLIDLNSMEPIPGGLFDQTLVGSNRWGKISLPFKVPNPAFEPVVRNLLGLTEKELRGILAGQLPLPEHLR